MFTGCTAPVVLL